MSAFIVSKSHIDMLLRGAIDRRALPGGMSADDCGRMLWLENLASIASRYPNDGNGDRPGPIRFRDEHAAEYEYTDPMYGPTDWELSKIIGCYSYQSCEHEEWETSDAHTFVTMLEAALGLPEVQSYPEEAGPWEWNATDIAAARVAGRSVAR